MRRLSTFVLLIGLAYPSLASATAVYDNGLPNTINGYPILQSAWTADDFTIAAGASVKSVTFYFQNFSGISGWDQQVDYEIFSDSSGLGVLLAGGSAQNLTAVDSGLPWCCGGGNAFQVDFDLVNPFNAAAGTTYWLKLTGAGGTATSAWWVTTDPNGSALGLIGGGGSSSDQHFAFALNNNLVPEPSTALLLACGLVGLWGRGSRLH